MMIRCIFTSLFVVAMTSVVAASDQVIEVIPLSDNCNWAVAPDGSGLVVASTDGEVADFLVGIATPNGFTTATLSVSDGASFIDVEGESGYSLAAPFVIQRGEEIAFALALTSDTTSNSTTSSWASRSWLDSYADWFNGTFGSGWSEAVGGVVHDGLTLVMEEETLANTSDGTLLTGTVIVSFPVAVGIVYGGEVAFGVGTFGAGSTTLVTGAGMSNAAIMRAFFTGQQLAQNPTTVAALYWYLQVARDVLARYQAMGYTGPGVATQTARIQQILEQLARWGLQ